jgi:hypothetical protein
MPEVPLRQLKPYEGTLYGRPKSLCTVSQHPPDVSISKYGSESYAWLTHQNGRLICTKHSGDQVYFNFPLNETKLGWHGVSSINVDAQGEHWRVTLRSMSSLSMAYGHIYTGQQGDLPWLSNAGWVLAVAQWGAIVASRAISS